MEKTKSQIKRLHTSSRRRLSLRKEFIEQNRLRNNYERKLRKQLSNYFINFLNDYAKEYESLGNTDIVFQRQRPILFEILDKHYRVVIEAFGLRMLTELQKQTEQFEAIYQEYAKNNLGQKIVGINEVTRRYVRKITTDGLNEGLGVFAIANLIREKRNRFSKVRSATIARTETHSAASFANHRVAQSMNLPNQRKRWVATQDARTRNGHIAINGTELPIDEDFIVNGKAMSYPGDPKGGAENVINCRCVLLYVNDLDEVV